MQSLKYCENCQYVTEPWSEQMLLDFFLTWSKAAMKLHSVKNAISAKHNKMKHAYTPYSKKYIYI